MKVWESVTATGNTRPLISPTDQLRPVWRLHSLVQQVVPADVSEERMFLQREEKFISRAHFQQMLEDMWMKRSPGCRRSLLYRSRVSEPDSSSAAKRNTQNKTTERRR